MKTLPTFEEVDQLLSYDGSTGIFKWKVRRSPKVKAGDVAGSLHPLGYVWIKLFYRRYAGHRIAWLLYHREWPRAELDHKNGIKSDNRIVNLREATRSQNAVNIEIGSNAAGFRGVEIVKEKRRTRIRARIRKEGKLMHLGYFQTKEQAHEAYRQAAVREFGEFARFT